MSYGLTPGVAAVLLRPWRYVEVMTATVLVYDYMLTLEREVQLVWPSSWNAVKVLFLLTRYIPFLDVIFVLFRVFSPIQSEMSCRALISLSGCTLIVGIGGSQAILCFRTWALWNRSRRVALMLGCIIASSLATVIIFEAFWFKSLTFGNVPGIGYAGCIVAEQSQIDAGGICLILLVELAVMVFTIIHLVRQYRQLGRKTFLSGVVGILYRDGILYFMCMFGISLANLMTVLLGSHSVKNILIDLQLVLHSVLAARVLFHLREATNRTEADEDWTPSEVSSHMVFASRPSDLSL